MSPHDEETVGAEEAEALALMAYVDGELDASEVAELEARADREPALRLKIRAAMQAQRMVGAIVRADLDRRYAEGNIEAIADEVIEALSKSSVHNVRSIADARKNKRASVAWVALGVVAAAAAAVFFVSTHAPNGGAGLATRGSGASSAAASIAQAGSHSGPSTRSSSIAVAAPSASVVAPLSEDDDDDLEIGQGASVIYSPGTTAVVWVNEPREGSL